jgi:hypothetical protein
MADSFSKLVPSRQSEFQNPPQWLCQAGYWFRVGFAFFLLLSVLLGIASCSSNVATVPWQRATSVVPQRVLEQVIQEYTELDATQTAETLLAWDIEGKRGKLTLFNFNTPDLCGALGCLYAGYWLQEDSPITTVFLSYLNPSLPQGQPLFQVGEYREQALPCLRVLQMDGDRLRQLNYCFNSDRYQLTNSQLFTS